VFVAAPFFQPEPLASRAPGFAACRSTFQAGLFVGGEEVAFETLADAIEFVRRGYTSGREFPDPTAPLGTPLRPIEGEGGGGAVASEWPEQELRPGGRHLDAAISDLVVQFDKATHEVHRLGASASPQWNLADKAMADGVYDMLRFASEALLRELLERLPATGGAEDSLVWVETSQRLVQLLMRLGLWPDIEWLVYSFLENAGSRFQERVAGFAKQLNLPHEPMGELFHHLFWRYARWPTDRTEDPDVYDDLSVLPLPRAIAATYRIGDSDPTLLTALCAWFGHVADARSSRSLDRAMLIFAAACAVVGPLRRQNAAFRLGWLIESTTIREQFYQRLGRDTLDWISAQLPNRAFNWKLEDLLRSIPRIWAKASLPPTSTPQSFDPEPIDGLMQDEMEQLVDELGEVLLNDEELPENRDTDYLDSLLQRAQAVEQAHKSDQVQDEHQLRAREAGA
jgi:hypothetical protein